MSSVGIIIGRGKLTTMGTGAEFCFCVDNSDVAQDSICHCLNHTTSTAFIFAHTIDINPDGIPMAGWDILYTWYGSVMGCWGQSVSWCGWARGRCRGGQTGVTGDGGRTAGWLLTPLKPTIAASKRGPSALNGCLGNCLLYKCQAIILQLQSLGLFCYALPEQPDSVYNFLVLLINLICPFQQSKYLACFTPL